MITDEPRDLERSNRTWDRLMSAIEAMEAPNPENPAGLSDLAYSRVMTGLHDDTWIRDFVPGAA